jgi:hypothetical protein
MSDIIKDIVEDINLKPVKSKLVLKWVIRISVGLISAAFIIGQVKTNHINKLNEIQKSVDNNTTAINNLNQQIVILNQQMTIGFSNTNFQFNKVYDDAYDAFNDFQTYNKKQLEIVIKYGQTNKELVMEMLDANSTEKTKKVEINLQQKKKENSTISIGVRPADKK